MTKKLLSLVVIAFFTFSCAVQNSVDIGHIKAAADSGDAKAQYDLATIYLKGRYVDADVNLAAKYLRLSAEQRYPEAQFELGKLYYYGQGVSYSRSEAIKYFKLAGEQGYGKAFYNLGNIYYQADVRNHYFEAVKYYTLAAKLGDAPALNNLATMYKYGEGVKQSYTKALHLYGEACDAGLQKGCDNYRRLKRHEYDAHHRTIEVIIY